MINTKKITRSSKVSFAELLTYGAMIEDGLMLQKNGSLFTAFEFRGDDRESATGSQVDAAVRYINSSLNRLGTGWMINVEAIRRETQSYIDSDKNRFPSTPGGLVFEAIETERRTMFLGDGKQFSTEYVMAISYTPPRGNASFLQSLFKDEGVEESSDLDRRILHFKQTVLTVTDGMKNAITVLKKMNGQEVFSFLNACVTGSIQNLALPNPPIFLDTYLARTFIGGSQPQIGGKHIRVVSVRGYPHQTHPGALELMSALPFEYRLSLRYIVLDKSDSEKALDNIKSGWKNAREKGFELVKSALMKSENTNISGDALAQEFDADQASQMAAAGEVKFGYLTQTATIISDTAKEADESARALVKYFSECGFIAENETINAGEAYLGSLPGHTLWNLRTAMCHTLNVSHIMPSTSSWTGHETHPCPFYEENSPPLFQGLDSSSGPFRFSMHVGDLGHTAIIGPTGAGKSTLLGLITASHMRYKNAQVFMFDKGYSSLALTLASGGEHYDIAADGSKIAFAPLQDLDTPADRAWAQSWIESLVQLSNGVTLTPQRSAAISDAILALSHRSKDRRELSEFTTMVQDEDLKVALSAWSKGAYASLFNANQDSFAEKSGVGITTFELEHLMNLDKKATVPALLYLFRCIEKRLDGRPSLIILDEAWLMLSDPVFSSKIREWLKVLRKANTAVVFATQSLADVMSSSIKSVIFESCPTKILLPNSAASTENAKPMYKDLGLNSRQIDIIARAIPKKHYYMMNNDGQRLFELRLGAVTLSFVAVSDKESVRAVKQLHAQHGIHFASEWLKVRGLEDWSNWLKNETTLRLQNLK